MTFSIMTFRIRVLSIIMGLFATLSIMTLGIPVYSAVKLGFCYFLNAILSVVMLNVGILNVAAPHFRQ
jgi:hypothetical protein